jgi:hypothetical protein
MSTLLRNLSGIPMGDDFFGGIVNRKNAIEKRMDAQKKATAYGPEKAQPKKEYKDDRNEYEKSVYGHIAYQGIGAESEAKIEKIKEVRAAKTIDVSSARPAHGSNIMLVTGATKAKIKKHRRHARAYKGMGDIDGFTDTVKGYWTKIKQKIGLGDADFGDFDLGARRSRNPIKRIFKRKPVRVTLKPPPKRLPPAQVAQFKRATPAQKRAIMAAASPAERRQIRYSTMTPAQYAAAQRAYVQRKQMARRSPAATKPLPTKAIARQQAMAQQKRANQQVLKPSVKSAVQPSRRSALKQTQAHKHKVHSRRIHRLAKASIEKHGQITPAVALIIEKLIREIKNKPVSIVRTTTFQGMGDEGLGAKKKAPAKKAPAKKAPAKKVGNGLNLLALAKKGAALIKPAAVVQPSGQPVAAIAPVAVAKPSIMTPKNMAIAGGVAAVAILGIYMATKKKKHPKREVEE